MKQTKAIEKAAARCRAAWEAAPNALFAWCCHHAIEIEKLNAPYTERINFILRQKSKKERVTRLNNFRPVGDRHIPHLIVAQKVLKLLTKLRNEALTSYNDELVKAEKSINLKKAHKEDVPKHTWNGHQIFKGRRVW